MPNSQSFAFTAPDAVQSSIPGGSGFRGGELVGGNATAGDYSPAANVDFAGQIGGFFDNLMKPYVEAKAKEQFIKGMTDQMYSQAGHEVKTDGFLSKIFGPTSYEEGAIFYQSEQRVAKVQTNWQLNEDNLKKLDPSEVSKAWSQALDEAKTGNKFVDAQIESSMLAASGPMLQSVAKARYKWQQENIVDNQQQYWMQSAEALQKQAESFAKTASPSDDQVQGFQLAVHNFLSGYKIINGQDEDSYKKSITNGFRAIIQAGYGHAATALMEGHILDVVDEKDRVSLEDAYQKYGQHAIGDAAKDHATELDAIEGQIKQGKAFTTVVQPAMVALNEQLKKDTGFNLDFFDATDEKAASSSIWGAVKSAYDKQEEHAWQLQRDAQNYQRQVDLEQMKAAAKAKLADTAWASANPAAAVVAGAVPAEDLQAAAYRAFAVGDYASLAKGFKSGSAGVSNAAKSAITNTIQSQTYSGYSQEFDNLDKTFNGMKQVDPATAKEYFGPNFPKMLQYDKLLASGVSKSNAFSQAFGDDLQYSANGNDVGTAKKWITDWVSSNANPGFLARASGADTAMSNSTTAALSNLLAREVAVDSKNAGADLSRDTLMQTAYQRVLRTGQFERYGKYGWTNRAGTTPLYTEMGMQQGEAQSVVANLIDQRLEKAGAGKSWVNTLTMGEFGDPGDVAIRRVTHAGTDALIVVPIDPHNGLQNDKAITITLPELKAAGKRYGDNQTTDPAQVDAAKAAYGTSGAD